MAISWTKEQQDVIALRDRDILVSAAAGSGKTAVLVERIIQKISDASHPIDIDRLLVVTFTKAAASQMREKIGAAIDAAIEREPSNLHLQRQAALLHKAMITTIDSFCLFVVRNHFDEIHLDPNFRIADEGEMNLLCVDTLEDVFERNYELLKNKDGNKAFRQLLDGYASKRSDKAVKDMVMKIYRVSQSNPWPKEWMKSLLLSYRCQDKAEFLQQTWLLDMVQMAKQSIIQLAKRYENCLKLCQASDGPGDYVSTVLEDLKNLEAVGDSYNFEELQSFVSGFAFGKLKSIRNFSGDAQKKELFGKQRDDIKKQFDKIRSNFFSMDLDTMMMQMQTLRPMMEILVQLSLEFLDAIDVAKRKKRVVDFSDIEHFALRILVNEEDKTRTSVAKEFGTHLEEIMIDEYQDSNQVQEEIMRAISREEEGIHNMFMVGDVKQSIYRFRLACPELFLEKYKAFSTSESVQQRIDLQMNFRSRSEVLDYCNDVFYKIMQPDFGGIQYDEAAALHCGAKYPQKDGQKTQLLFLDNEEEERKEQLQKERDVFGENSDKKTLEAHLVAQQILKLKAEGKVSDDSREGFREIKYSDIVILFRSIKDWGSTFAKVLEGYGIPVHVDLSTGYFSALEVQTVLNFLRILDNPYQDIPLAAVLKSPIVRMDEEELAEIRVSNPKISFSKAAFSYMMDESNEKANRFYQIYQKLRSQKEDSIHTLIQKLLLWTGYGTYVRAMPAGERRYANVQMLLQKAIDFEKTSYRGLFDFIRYMDQLEKYEVDFGEADVTGEHANVVHIMTIHKSKGLEFPVVFASGMGKQFNEMDLNNALLVHSKWGMALPEMQLITKGDLKVKVKKDSVYRFVLAQKMKEENLAEEMRVLYVAFTRAKEKMFVTGVVSSFEKMIQNKVGNVKPDEPIPYGERVAAKTYLDWILPAMLSYPDKYEISPVSIKTLLETDVKVSVEKQLDYETVMAQIKQVKEEDWKVYEEAFSYEYPHKEDIGKKIKYSVSELKHDSMVRKYMGEEKEAEKPEFLTEEKSAYIPDFISGETSLKETENPGAKRGTAIHRLMEGLEFNKLLFLADTNTRTVYAFVEEQIEKQLQRSYLTKEQAQLITINKIVPFLQSEVAMSMAKAAANGDLYREKPFVMQYEDALVQGIIDVFWIDGNEITLLDYKTDKVEHQGELVARYQTQMELYGDALAKAYSTDTQKFVVKKKLIYSFGLKEVISV